MLQIIKTYEFKKIPILIKKRRAKHVLLHVQALTSFSPEFATQNVHLLLFPTSRPGCVTILALNQTSILTRPQVAKIALLHAQHVRELLPAVCLVHCLLF